MNLGTLLAFPKVYEVGDGFLLPVILFDVFFFFFSFLVISAAARAHLQELGFHNKDAQIHIAISNACLSHLSGEKHHISLF